MQPNATQAVFWNMALRHVALLTLTISLLAACGKSSAPTVSVSLRQLTMAELSQLTAKGMAADKEAILITCPFDGQSMGPLRKELMSKSYRMDVGLLRNPNAEVFIVRAHMDGAPLDTDDKKGLQEIADRLNATIWPGLRVAPKFGPDGKTPMVLPPNQKVYAAEPGIVGPVTICVSFPAQSIAQEAVSTSTLPTRPRS